MVFFNSFFLKQILGTIAVCKGQLCDLHLFFLPNGEMIRIRRILRLLKNLHKLYIVGKRKELIYQIYEDSWWFSYISHNLSFKFESKQFWRQN